MVDLPLHLDQLSNGRFESAGWVNKGILVAGTLEIASERIIVARGDGIELMIMAAGAGDGLAEKGFAEDIDLTIDDIRLFLPNVHRGLTAFFHPKEPGGDDGFVGFVFWSSSRNGEQIASEMLDDEFIVGEIEIVCPDHIIPVAPRMIEIEVELESQGFRIADQVEPVASPAFTIAR